MGIGYDLAGGCRAESAGIQSQKNGLRHESAMKNVTVHVLPAPSTNIPVEQVLGPIVS